MSNLDWTSRGTGRVFSNYKKCFSIFCRSTKYHLNLTLVGLPAAVLIVVLQGVVEAAGDLVLAHLAVRHHLGATAKGTKRKSTEMVEDNDRCVISCG